MAVICKRLFKRKGRLLRLRPGPLANFSGGAGFMPFVIYLSLPASIIFGIISSMVLFHKRSTLREGPNIRNYPMQLVSMHDFTRYSRTHIKVCAVLTVLAGLMFYFMGLVGVFGNKLEYAAVTFVIAVGPLIAAFLSMLVLVKLLINNGAKWTNLVVAAIIYFLLLLACIPLIMFVSAITDAQL